MTYAHKKKKKSNDPIAYALPIALRISLAHKKLYDVGNIGCGC